MPFNGYATDPKVLPVRKIILPKLVDQGSWPNTAAMSRQINAAILALEPASTAVLVLGLQ